jgi:hypothetical protein
MKLRGVRFCWMSSVRTCARRQEGASSLIDCTPLTVGNLGISVTSPQRQNWSLVCLSQLIPSGNSALK